MIIKEITRIIVNELNARGYSTEEKYITKNNNFIAGLIFTKHPKTGEILKISPIIKIDNIITSNLEDTVNNAVKLFNEEYSKSRISEKDNIFCLLNSREAVINCLMIRVQQASNDENIIKASTAFDGIEKYLSLNYFDEKGTQSVNAREILEEMFLKFSISMSEAWEYAENNLRKNADIFNISNIFPFPITSESDMTIVSNKARIHGAASILDASVLFKAAKKIGTKELIILPSSIHETIALPFTEEINMKNCVNLVKTVNTDESCLSPEEILSNNAYYVKVENEETYLVKTFK